MTQQHGRRYEHKLTKSLEENTWGDVWVTTCGWSGNSAVDACDLVVTVSPKLATRGESLQYNIEAKKRQGKATNRTIIFSGSSDESGVEEVQRLIEGTPDWGRPLVALKWDHRQLMVFDARSLLAACENYEYEQEPVTIKSPVFAEDVREASSDDDAKSPLSTMEPRLTGSGSISCIKPTTEQWYSAQTGEDDGKYLADQLELR